LLIDPCLSQGRRGVAERRSGGGRRKKKREEGDELEILVKE
jgi:hypothetical protein